MTDKNLKVYDAGNNHIFFKACSKTYLVINKAQVKKHENKANKVH
jgi:hypothetical protein